MSKLQLTNKDIIISIDAGTTGNRAIAISKRGELVAQAYYPMTQYTPKPGWVEHDPKEMLDTTMHALHDVIKSVGIGRIACIGMTNQRETTIVWDRKTGEPIHRAIVWQCRRTADICNELKSHAVRIKERTGLFLDPYFSATKIKWILDHVEGARARAKDGQLAFGTPETWLLWNLTGGKVHATEPSNASRTMIFNIKSCAFDEELLALFDVPRAILPQVKDSDALFGHAKLDGESIPIHGILGDQQASLFAHGGWMPGVVKNTYGTGLFAMTGTQEHMPRSEKLITTIAWRRGEKTHYALEGSVFMGGATLQWLRDNLGIITNAAESEQIAASIPDNEGVYFVPALQGLGAPHWRSDVRGAIVGLTRKANRAGIIRAALEAMAYQTYDVIQCMSEAVPHSIDYLRVDGGACANNFLMQFQSDILDIPVERPVNIENTAWGAAGIAAIASGVWTIDEFFEIACTTERIFRPTMSKRSRDQNLLGWQEAMASVL